MMKPLNILLTKLKKINSFCLILLICCACSEANKSKGDGQLLSLKKERKIAVIESQIDRNCKVRDEANKKIIDLKEKLFSTQLDLINKKVKKFKENEKFAKNQKKESANDQNDRLFLEERKMLTGIIEDSTIYSDKAQTVLNDILEIITKLNDSAP